MTIIVFLVDTSASMCQRALVNGVQKTYLDIAKGAVETFLKFRQRSQDCMGDRYMLLTFEEPPNNVKAGWKENHATFMNELKNLQSTGLTTMGDALKNAFDLLNLNRMQSGIDTYGQGRCPFYLEPSVIIVLTDGGKYTFRNGVHQEIILPLQTHMPGTKLTKEPFRWDQRLFSLVLRMPGNRVEERADGKVPHDDSMIEKMCEVTGGRSYKIKSHYVLNQCIESLVQKVQPGVVIHFDQLISSNGSDSSTTDLQFQPTKRMIYVPKQHPSQKTFPVGYWPIPEPYWPDPKLTNLPPRDAHPKIKIISPSCDEPQVLRNFPIDKYELEASPLTLQILSKKESNKVWPLIVSTGLQGEMPFGYLKPNSTVPIVHLYVLPYNYQMLLPLINDLFHKFNLNPPNDWVYKFTNYVKTIPQYYCPFLRRALATTPNVPYQLVQYILPENLDSYLCPAVANYLKQMKNTAKIEQENLCLRVLKQLKQPKPAYHQLETAKLTVSQQTKRDLVSHPMLKDTFTKLHMEIANFDSYTIVVPSIIQTAATKNYRNPYDIPRRDLIDEIARMRENFFQLPTSGINVYTKDSGHCLPISDMGNYQEYLKNKETPLRELEPTNVRQHMFGNPYKKDKNMVMVDEADLNDLAPMKAGGGGLSGPHPGSSGGGGSGGGGTNSGTISLSGTSSSAHMKKGMDSGTVTRLARKRKAGPIRKDYVFKRSAKDMASSSSSGSIAGEDVHMSELLTDDESCSEFSGASDIEDDNEGCLVMALDTPEESAEVVVSVATVATTAASAAITAPVAAAATSAPARERDSAGGETADEPITTTTAASSNSEKQPVVPPNGTSEDVGAVPAGEPMYSTVIQSLENRGLDDTQSVDDKEQPQQHHQTDEKQTQEPTEPIETSVIIEPEVPAQQQQQQTAKKQTEASVPEQSNFGSDSKDAAAKQKQQQEAAKEGVEERPDPSSSPGGPLKEASVERSKPDQLEPSTTAAVAEDGGVKLLVELNEQKDYKCKVEQYVVEWSEEAIGDTPDLVMADEQQEPAKADDYVQTDPKMADETSGKETEDSKPVVLVRLKPEEIGLYSRSVDYYVSLKYQSNDYELAVQANHTPQPTEPAKSAQDGTLGESALPQQQPQQQPPQPSSVSKEAAASPWKQDQRSPESSRHPASSQKGHDTNNGITDGLKAPKQQQQQQQQQQPNEQRPAPQMRQQPAASQWSLDANDDMTDVMKISNILKTCHNGGDTERDKDAQTEDGAGERNSTGGTGTTNATPHDTTKTPDPNPVMVVANGFVSMMMNGGGGDNGSSSDPTVQPTLNWDYNFALYSCVEDEQELEQIEETNLKTRSIVFRDIRRPGRDYTQLLKHLELVQGSRSTQKHFVDACVHEARRFRRHRMVECIQEWWAQHTGRSAGNRRDGGKRARSKQQPGGGPNTFYIYGNSDGLLQDDQDNFFFPNDTGATVYGSKTFRSTTPPGPTYLNSGGGGGGDSTYGTTDFSHNNHHFVEVTHEPYPNS
ncbi:integrator complex subunit 6 [Anopheles stephensi]|uniref:integrator complex subunit 6 n=1 Tax=Anopheles stephensi TaxID=30069 RepID=UPI0007D6AC79|nr:integrator complex subunit 6 [Anopheles stephensi]XP_035898428.1 integrator complex subunit 6 [Anopheles stephensi]XP_035898437.1 integrator complex subunit 6 [Anopheles stephensi]XP_035898446.1 integrator complex subunit 6 [Anopheles stephensi]XP_035898454.1 integrator complex subunit 6 [Anopheles stephensi]XP_035898462.1 integrator complex subunit 6 [Anopheles stephensi]XP_035898471.1 integrator complex subunit 6 [Anopheles stephensi]XP_035898478.1 integrator complex subunit 6 [Anophele